MIKIIIGFIISSSVLLSVAHAAEQLTATIIGSGSPIYNENRASASTLISAGKTHILVDMGNGTQANLDQLGVDVRTLSALLFTHHHLDHNEEFVPIFIRSLLGRDNFTIVGPPATTKLTETNLDLYKEDISYRLGKSKRTLSDRQKAFEVRDIQGGESFKIDDIQVTTIQVPHTIHSVAYRFDYKGQSIVISGDLTYSDKLPSLAKNADFLIMDSGGMVITGGKAQNKGANNKGPRTRAHLSLADSSNIAEKAKVKNLVYTHFNKGTLDTQASLKEIRKNYTGKVIFAEDLMVLEHHVNITSLTQSYPVVDTGQRKFYSNDEIINLPAEGENFFGQDASYIINAPSYSNNNDGTVTDNVTGLMWQKDMGNKLSYQEALQKVQSNKLAGYSDWRVPTIKELYSLIQFSGSVKGQHALYPFIDTRYFNQPLGQV
ncbi:MAG: DUF1566 domain-containing protein [Psychromonas sp.]